MITCNPFYIRFYLRKEERIAFAESIDPCQPAQSTQVDVGPNFFASINFLISKESRPGGSVVNVSDS